MTNPSRQPLTKFQVKSHCRKHVLFTGTDAMDEGVAAILSEFTATEFPVEWNRIEEHFPLSNPSEVFGQMPVAHTWRHASLDCGLHSYLRNQPIGTCLYLACSWSSARSIERIAREIGYGSDEIQIQAYGQRYTQVFCISCYHIHPLTDSSVLTCPNCGKTIEASDVYSRHLDAVLGYIMVDNHLEKGTPSC